jgi:O-antigen ligase
MEAGPDLWPRTTRPLPWLLAGMLALIFLVPLDGVELSIPSPVDPSIDRVALLAIAGAWIVVSLLGRPTRIRFDHSGLFLGMALAFVTLAFLSVVLNIGEIARQDLFGLAFNRLALLCAFVMLAFFAVSALRPEELPRFSALLVFLAALTALGVIWERRTGFNVFYEFASSLFSPIADVAPAPTEISPDPAVEARKTIVGPTEHGLAVTAMLVMTLPFALVGFIRRTDKKRWLYAAAVALIVAAALSTERKTAVLTPVAVGLVLVYYRPRVTARMLPLLAGMAVFIAMASPGALGTVTDLGETFNSDSSSGRFDDYSAIAPQFLRHPLFGSGYGTRDIADVEHVRILDNEYLASLLSIGLLGTALFLATILSAMVVAHRTIRSGDDEYADIALASSAGCMVFLVVSLLFDSMSFAEAPYTFFLIAAMGTVAAGASRARAPAKARAAPPPRRRGGAQPLGAS